MYIINIMNNNPTIYQLKEERLQILFGKIVEIRDWNSSSLRASFWRCYCPFESGGIIIYQRKEIPLTPGKGFIIPPLTDFGSRNKNTFTKAFCHFAYEVRNLSFISGIYQFPVPQELRLNLEKMKNAPDKIQNSAAELQMLQLVSMGLAAIPGSAKQELQINERIQKLLNYITVNTTGGVNNNDLAALVKLTVPSMIRLFKESMGVSPQQYQKTLRMQHAGTLLVHTDKSLEEIAEECGFWDRNHFTRAFTAFLKCPPANYRKINRR